MQVDAWLRLPLAVRDLSPHDVLLIRLISLADGLAQTIASCVVRLFDDKLRLREGPIAAVLWPHPGQEELPQPSAVLKAARKHGAAAAGAGSAAMPHASPATCAPTTGRASARPPDSGGSEGLASAQSSPPPRGRARSDSESSESSCSDARQPGEPLPADHWMSTSTMFDPAGGAEAWWHRVAHGREEVAPLHGLHTLAAAQTYMDAARDLAAVVTPEGARIPAELLPVLHLQLPTWESPVVWADAPSAEQAPRLEQLDLPPVPLLGATGKGRALSKLQLPSDWPEIHGDWDADGLNPWARGMCVYPDPEMSQVAWPAMVEAAIAEAAAAEGGEADSDGHDGSSKRGKSKSISYVLATMGRTITDRDRRLIWKHRKQLSRDVRAITKLVLATRWDIPARAEEAHELLAAQWPNVSAASAMRLLCRDVQHEVPRMYAVEAILHSSNSGIRDLLLQFVQALRYEPGLLDRAAGIAGRLQALLERAQPGVPGYLAQVFPSVSMADLAAKATRAGSSLVSKFFNASRPDTLLVSDWLYQQAKEVQPASSEVPAALRQSMRAGARRDTPVSPAGSVHSAMVDVEGMGVPLGDGDLLSPLADALIARACGSFPLASNLYWFLSVEIESAQADSAVRTMFGVVRAVLLARLGRLGERGIRALAMLVHSCHFSLVLQRACTVGKSAGSVERKAATIRSMLSQGGQLRNMLDLASPIPLPLDPTLGVVDFALDKTAVFRSAEHPIRLGLIVVPLPDVLADPVEAWRSVPSERRLYQIMAKDGDDLRQDQLVIQMIALMHSRLLSMNLDLQLIPYPVLATSPVAGMLEFVPQSAAVDSIKSDIQAYFRQALAEREAPDAADMDAVLDTYAKSCAGYCVITYILGVGDRHLDNLMIRKNGQFFHIDFGFIFGRDPKPMPPAIKLTKHMIQGMGGVESRHYKLFRSKCREAFSAIRRSAGMFLDLLLLMYDAGIADMGKTDAAKDAVIDTVQQKFLLDIADEKAEAAFMEILDVSISALFPHVTDYIHTIATVAR